MLSSELSDRAIDLDVLEHLFDTEACGQATVAAWLVQELAGRVCQVFTFESNGPIIMTMSNRHRASLRANVLVRVLVGVLAVLVGSSLMRWTDSQTRGPMESEPEGPYRLQCPECLGLHPKTWRRLPAPTNSAWICRNPDHEPTQRVPVEA